MVPKLLKSGVIAYYWDAPTWARRKGCPVAGEALGTDYAIAKRRCDEVLNPQFDAWRTQGEIAGILGRPLPGSFDWMVAIYKTHPWYTQRPAKTRKSYDSVLSLVSKYALTDGRKFGSLPLSNITPGATDRLFEKLKIKSDGGDRTRTALLAMRVCRRAWETAHRDKQTAIPAFNPFANMEITYEAKPTRPVTHIELLRFVKAADEAGENSLGTAAMIAYYWLQREEDIISRLSWNHYRPVGAPDVARIFHHKTGKLVDIPLHDEDGTVLWPELMKRLDGMSRYGTLIVTRDRLDRRRKVRLPWKADYFRHRVAAIRATAGIDFDAKFMGLRHGGNTEGGNADLTDAQIRALSGHKTTAMTALYTKATMKQRRVGARKRLEERTKGGNLSE
jgi:hypothetical protein